ncbi:MAG TPA: DNA alkylation repair protein [Melioribacteraceae bacterium]|nr:DNA alkylation repair protein [Melioribacteraceae bacterium]
MNVKEIIAELKKNGSQYNREGMKKFGINVDKAFGVNVPVMRKLAKKIGKNHKLAIKLWESGYHEARHVATMIADPKLTTRSLLNNWVKDFNSWDIVDGSCSNLIRKTDFAYDLIPKWVKSNKEFVRRTAFSLIAYLAVHDKKKNDEEFLQYLPLIKEYSTDERNFVKKAVNWALRQIGKRSTFLNEQAIQMAEEIKLIDSKTARWIASDALRELKNHKTFAGIKE